MIGGQIGKTVITQFKGYRVGWVSFHLTIDRKEIPEGEFGYISAWECDQCGPIPEPEQVCTYRGRWGYDGGEPDEWEYQCPYCDSIGICGENDPRLWLKAGPRYRVIL